jgi:hypothetical protein
LPLLSDSLRKDSSGSEVGAVRLQLKGFVLIGKDQHGQTLVDLHVDLVLQSSDLFSLHQLVYSYYLLHSAVHYFPILLTLTSPFVILSLAPHSP